MAAILKGRPPARLIAEFSNHVIATDLPALPAERRADVVAFAGRRIAALPSPMKLGVGIVAVVVGGLGRIVGLPRLTAVLVRRPLPVLGDYVRLVRSLSYAYVWETWPSTGPDGSSVD
ncbi:MAG TPA: hypothetical protein VEK09_05325 [Jatrophihabitantaceae bacterium]|nr:hypothetical protein [Jatrophihabitantaceae bacterium]